MAKQLLISQNDYGIIFNVQIFNDDKTPVVLGEDNVKFYVITPSNEKIDIKDEDITVVDKNNGKVEFEIEQSHTAEIGNHNIYLEISNATMQITTVYAQSYYVMAQHGGA